MINELPDLPDLPFEHLLSYLSLEDRLKARTVSRAWRNKFHIYPLKTLCYSACSSDFIEGKGRWVSGAFAKNFISSTRFTTFFDTFGQTILSSLKQLRLCELNLCEGELTTFPRILNSFGQLEELDIVQVECSPVKQINLNLPMLTSIQIEYVRGIEKLTLETSRLRAVKLLGYYPTSPRLEIIHGESVERLHVDQWEYTGVRKLKNLHYLYVTHLPSVDSTFLSSRQQLKEIHLRSDSNVSKLFEQKQRFGRADLKIYINGLLLNGPDDRAMNVLRDSSSSYLSRKSIVYLAKNRSRLADEIAFYSSLYYSDIQILIAPELEVDFLKRFTDLNGITVDRPVRDTQRFLDLLSNCDNIMQFDFDGDQPQDLFDRLPEHCAVQKLKIRSEPSDLTFLFRLKHLIHLDVDRSIDIETVRRAFEELPVLIYFVFIYDHKKTSIRIDQFKQLRLWIDGKKTSVPGLNAAIEFITGT